MDLVVGPGFKSQLWHCFRQTVHTHRASVHQAAKLVAAVLRVAMITAGLVESNGSLLQGLWLTSPAGWLPRTGISSGTIRLAVEYGLPFYIASCVVDSAFSAWRCWLGGRKGIRPVKNWVVRVLAWLSVWSEVQTCTWPSWCHCHSLSCFNKIQIGFAFLVPAHPGSPGQRAVKRVCVCVVDSASFDRSLAVIIDASLMLASCPRLVCVVDPSPRVDALRPGISTAGA